MKRVVLSVFILAFALLFCLLSYNYLESRISHLENELNECYVQLDTGMETSARETADKITEYWVKNKNKIGLFVNGEAFERFGSELKMLDFYIQEQNISDAKESIAECKKTLSDIRERERLSIDTVL